MKLFLSILLTVFSILFLILAPSFFMPELEKNIYSVREEQKESNFEGFLTLWHVADYPNSGRAQLNAAVRRIEKKYLHVYIEAETLNGKTALDRMQKGEFLDILSFPAGFLEDPSLLAQVAPDGTILQKLQDACLWKGGQYAYPYMLTAIFPSPEEELGDASRIAVHVQYIAFAKTEDQKKKAMCMNLASLLLSESMQKNLVKMNCIPVITAPGLYETEDETTMVYTAITESLHFPAVFPGPLV